jgi:hypothetical protein
MAEVYKLFSDRGDFSEKSLLEMYNYESRGIGDLEQGLFCNNWNGYYLGKKNLNITVSMWKEDIKTGLLHMVELYNDFPHWWLNKVFDRRKAPVNFLK